MSVTGDRLGQQAVEVGKDLQEMGGIIKDAAQETLGQLRGNVSERYEHGRDRAQDVMSTCGQFVRERPVQSLLIAGGIGLLFGRFWMRR